MKYTVEVNEKSVVVNLDGYKGVAKCCEGDTFNLQTGIELALERARVAKANANKPKPTVAEAIKVLEEYVGDHIAIVGKGVSLSENQQNELRRYADMYAPTEHKCCDCCGCDCCDYDEDEDEDDYDEGDYDKYEPNCGCHDNGGCECGEETLETLATRMIARIREILGE